MAKQKRQSIEEIIERAIAATRIAATREAKDTFKATEKRLYAFPIIQIKIEDDIEKMEEVKAYGARSKSKSITRFTRTGMRLTPEEIRDALVQDLTADIARNEIEVETIKKALEIIATDPYADIVKYKYFDEQSDEHIAAKLQCDPSTVRRNKSRLVGRLAVFLYGVNAIV